MRLSSLASSPHQSLSVPSATAQITTNAKEWTEPQNDQPAEQAWSACCLYGRAATMVRYRSLYVHDNRKPAPRPYVSGRNYADRENSICEAIASVLVDNSPAFWKTTTLLLAPPTVTLTATPTATLTASTLHRRRNCTQQFPSHVTSGQYLGCYSKHRCTFLAGRNAGT